MDKLPPSPTATASWIRTKKEKAMCLREVLHLLASLLVFKDFIFLYLKKKKKN